MLRRYASRVALVGILGIFALALNDHVVRAALPPVDVPGSAWVTQGILKAKIPGEGTFLGAGTGYVFFGPYVDPSLTETGFLLAVLDEAEEAIEVLGTYSEIKDGKPIVVVDFDALASELEALFGEELTITVLKATVKAKPKNTKLGEIIKVQFKTQFLVADVASVKVSIQYKGSGTRGDAI